MIRALLIIGICLPFLWFIRGNSSTRTQAFGKLVVVGLFLLALISIIFPNITNDFAKWVGVGRGADLLLYILTIVFLYSLLIQYVNKKDQNNKMVELARRQAILETNLKDLAKREK